MAPLRSIVVFGLMAFTPVWRQQSEPPVFHAAAHLVQINVIVRDRDGHPVGDLTKEDFIVKDRGKPQTISVFSVESATAVSQQQQPLPQNTFSDEAKYQTGSARSVTIILLDNLNTLSGSAPQPYENTPYWVEAHALANAKQHLLEFLKHSDPQDRIAIYGLSENLRVLCDFTCDRDQLVSVVNQYDATSKTRREAASPATYHTPVPGPEFNALMNADVQRLAALTNRARAGLTMAALGAITDHVIALPGRKNLLWLTANLPFSGQAVARVISRANIIAYPVDARGLLPRAPALFTGEMDADAYAQGKLSTSPAESPQPTGIDAMRQMAEATGGRAFVNSNDLTGAIRSVIDDSSVTYTLGFYVEAASLDDKFHELQVLVKRPGLRLQEPKGYFASGNTRATEDERNRDFLSAIRSPLDSTAIPLLARVDRVDQPNPHSLQVSGSVGIVALQLVQERERRSGALNVYLIEQDAAGNVLHQTSNRMRLDLTEPQYQAYLRSGIQFRESVQPSANATILRVIVQDSNSSEIGSVIIPLGQVK